MASGEAAWLYDKNDVDDENLFHQITFLHKAYTHAHKSPRKKSPFLSTQKTRRTKRSFSFLLKKRSVTCPFYVIRRNHPPTLIYFICRFWCWLWCYITYNDLFVQLCYTRNSTALTLTTKLFFFSFDNFCQRDEDEDDNMRFIHSRFFTSWFYLVGKLTFVYYTIAISGIFPLLFFYSPRLKITLLYRIAQIYFFSIVLSSPSIFHFWTKSYYADYHIVNWERQKVTTLLNWEREEKNGDNNQIDLHAISNIPLVSKTETERSTTLNKARL